MDKVQDKINFQFKPNNMTSFRNYSLQQSTERQANHGGERPFFPVSPNNSNNTRTPLLEPRRTAPTSLLLENRHQAALSKSPKFKVPNSATTRELLKNSMHRHKNADNNSNIGPHSFLKKKSDGSTDYDMDFERSRKTPIPLPMSPLPSPNLKPVQILSETRPGHPSPVNQDLDSFVQSYRQLQSDCEQYKFQLENNRRTLVEERTKAEQSKAELISNFSCVTELDHIRYQHTETRLRQWDEYSVLFQNVMTSMDRLVSHDKPKPSTELEVYKSKLRHLHQLWSGQIYDVTWVKKYKSALTCLMDGIQQQRTDIKSFLSNTVKEQSSHIHYIHEDVRIISRDLTNIATSSSIEAVTIEGMKCESQLVSKRMNGIVASLRDMDEMVLVESVNESSLKVKCEQLEVQNEQLKKEIQRNEKNYLTDAKLLKDENQNLLAQLEEAQTPKRRRIRRKLPSVQS